MSFAEAIPLTFESEHSRVRALARKSNNALEPATGTARGALFGATLVALGNHRDGDDLIASRTSPAAAEHYGV